MDQGQLDPHKQQEKIRVAEGVKGTSVDEKKKHEEALEQSKE